MIWMNDAARTACAPYHRRLRLAPSVGAAAATEAVLPYQEFSSHENQDNA